MSLKLATVFYFLVVFTAISRSNHVRKYRMIGGSEAKPHEFPHMVALDRDYLDRDDFWHFCGGAILNENWVITAAHCKWLVPSGKRFRIMAGKHSINSDEDTEQVIYVAKVFVHEKYPGGKCIAPHDIALLKLEKPLVFNKYVKPISLPEKHSQTDGEVVFSGWGMAEHWMWPDRLQKARMIVIDTDSCKKADISVSGSPSAVTDTMLCTSPSPNGVFGCDGDSGSPLIKQENDKTYLVGIFSWISRPCGREGSPSVFNKVSSYVDWIEHIVSNN